MTTSCPFMRRASDSTRRTDASSSTTPTLVTPPCCRTFTHLPPDTGRVVRLRSGRRGDRGVMTSTIDGRPATAGTLSRRSGPARPWLRRARRLPVEWVVVLVAVGLRLPLLSRPPSPDEAGFLLVGGQWHSGGTSLYGDYWVDRAPPLITLFPLRAGSRRPRAPRDHPRPPHPRCRRAGAGAAPRLRRPRAHDPGRGAPRSPAGRSR